MDVNDYLDVTSYTYTTNPFETTPRYVSTQITNKYAILTSWEEPYTDGLTGVFLTSTTLQPGDSGAPCYVKYPDQQAEIYMVYACGIVTGGIYEGDELVHCVVSTVENIEDSIGENFDFVTDR